MSFLELKVEWQQALQSVARSMTPWQKFLFLWSCLPGLPNEAIVSITYYMLLRTSIFIWDNSIVKTSTGDSPKMVQVTDFFLDPLS